MPRHPSVVKLTGFKGINNIARPENTDPTFLKRADNVDIDRQGTLHKRKGYTLVDSGEYTSLWSSSFNQRVYGVKDGDIIEVLGDYSSNVLQAGSFTEVSFEEIDNKIYVISPQGNFLIEDSEIRSLGISKINPKPTLSYSSGLLDEGAYQLTYTYVDISGLESGTGSSSLILVPDKSSITFSVPVHADPRIIKANIYSSSTNGGTLYYAGTITPGSTFTLQDSYSLVNPLKTFNLDAPPLGDKCGYYKGRLYISDGNVLYYSEPYSYEHFNLYTNFIEYPDRIKEICVVDDGIWIASDKLYYLSGGEPDSFKQNTKEYISVIEGSAVRVSGSYLQIDNTPAGYKYLVSSDLGIFVLFNQGLTFNLTSEFLNLERSDKATSIFMQENGLNKYLSILQKNGEENNSVIGDTISGQIVRNGIVV